MDTVVQASYKAKLYVCGGTASFPANVGSIYGATTTNQSTLVYTELSIIGDVTHNIAFGETNVSVRGAGGIKLTAEGLSEIAVDFMIPVIRGEPKREALVKAAFARSVVGLVILTDAISDVLSKGFAIDCQIFKADREESIEGNLVQKFTAKPTLSIVDTNGTISPLLLVAGATNSQLQTATAF